MKNSKCTLLIMLIISMTCQAYSAVPGAAQPPYAPGAAAPGATMPPLSEAELLQWQQEVDKEINAFVSTLPATRAEAEALSAQTGEKVISQEEFHQEVAVMEEKMKEMAAHDEQYGTNELGSFLNTIFPSEEQVTPPAVMPVEQPAIEAEPAVTSKEELKEENTERVSNILNNIITRLERFLRRVPQIPEFAGSVATWIKQDKIKEWRHDLTWATLKADIESFNHILHHIKDSKDPKTKKHRYLTLIKKDESLLNNLNKVSSNLTLYESKMVEPSELGKTSQATLNAVKDVLGVFTESLYTLELPQELKKLIAAYEPQAKILREEHDAATKRATEETKRVAPAAPRREASSIGYGASPAVGVGGNEYYGGYSPYGGNYGPGAGYSPYADHGYEQPMAPEKAAGQQPGVPGAGGKPGAGGAAAEKGGKAGAESKAEGAKEAEKPGAPKPAEAPIVEDPALNKLVEKFAKNIDAAAASIEDNEDVITKFDAHITAKTKVDMKLITSLTSSRGITKSLRKAIDAIKELKGKLLKADKSKRDHYFKKVKFHIQDTSKLFAAVAEQFKKALEHQPQEIPVTKLYAYLGQENLKEEAIKAEPALSALEYPTNVIVDVLTVFEKYKEALKGV